MLLKELEFKICNLSTIFLTITAGEPSSAAQHSKTARDVGSGTWRWSRVKMLDRLIRLKIRNIYIYIWVLYDMYNIYIIYTYMIHIYIYMRLFTCQLSLGTYWCFFIPMTIDIWPYIFCSASRSFGYSCSKKITGWKCQSVSIGVAVAGHAYHDLDDMDIYLAIQ